MTTQLTYRTGTIHDLPRLKELGIAAYGSHAPMLTPENWAKMEANLHDEQRLRQLFDSAETFVCTDNDTIVGMAYLVPPGQKDTVYPADWYYVRTVGVHPDYRGNGICRKLMQQCIDRARQNGGNTIGLHTSEIMNDARHIYESMGFTVVRELPETFGLRYWLFWLDL